MKSHAKQAKPIIMLILYADDDPDDCEILGDAIHGIDPSICCCFANNGVEALKFLQSTANLPDCILLDINMPLMNGKACLGELKNNARLKAIPVIMYSTSFLQEEVFELYRLGASSVIQKPKNVGEMRSTLQKLLQAITVQPVDRSFTTIL